MSDTYVIECPECKGSGRLIVQSGVDALDIDFDWDTCDRCGGKGFIKKRRKAKKPKPRARPIAAGMRIGVYMDFDQIVLLDNILSTVDARTIIDNTDPDSDTFDELANLVHESRGFMERQ